MKNAFLKTTSLLLVTLCFANEIIPADMAWAFSKNAPVSFSRESILFPEFARVEWKTVVPSRVSRGWIYLVQDAHQSLLAQNRITQILLRLHSQKALDAVMVEGASERLTRERFNIPAHLDINPERIDTLERKGYLHGAAAFYLAKPEVPAQGLESPDLYRRNLQAFRNAFKSSQEIERIAESFRVEWQRWLAAHAGEKERQFFMAAASLHSNPADSAYFEQLIRMATDRLGIRWKIQDQTKWPNLIRVERMLKLQVKVNRQKSQEAFQRLRKILGRGNDLPWKKIQKQIDEFSSHGTPFNSNELRNFSNQLMLDLLRRKISIIAYQPFFDWLACVVFQGEIEPEGLIQEIEKIENALWEKEFKNKEDRRWMELGRLAVLLEKASRLELSRYETAKFIEASRSGQIQFWISRLAPQKLEYFKKFKIAVEDFYSTAKKREEIFQEKVDALFGSLTQEKKGVMPRVAVVLGGYHQDGMVKRLRSQSYEVAVVTPRLEKLDQDVAYRENLLQDPAQSALAMVPAAVVSTPMLQRLVGPALAQSIEFQLQGLLGKREEAVMNARSESRKNFFQNRRSFLTTTVLGGAALLLSQALAPRVLAADNDLESLLRSASSAPLTQSQLKAPLFPTEELRLNGSDETGNFLANISERIDTHLAGQELKWRRIQDETLRQRATKISALATASSGSGGFKLDMGAQISGMSPGDKLEITDGGMSFALKTIGILVDEIFVNSKRKQSDKAALKAADLQYEWKKVQLAGQVFRLLNQLHAAKSKLKILELYEKELRQAYDLVRKLEEKKTVSIDEVNRAKSFLNEALDEKARLQNSILQVEAHLAILLGEDFNLNEIPVVAPSKSWLAMNAEDWSSQSLEMQIFAEESLPTEISNRQADAQRKTAQAEKRNGWFNWFIRRGPANSEKKRQELKVGKERLSSNPTRARAQVETELLEIEARKIAREARDQVRLRAEEFFQARTAHLRWQDQTASEQQSWLARGLLNADYASTLLESLRRLAQAQVRVIDTRATMSSAAIDWFSMGVQEIPGSSQNWLQPVLLKGYFLQQDTSGPSRSEIRKFLKQISRSRFLSQSFWQKHLTKRKITIAALVAVFATITVIFIMGPKKTEVLPKPAPVIAEKTVDRPVWNGKGLVHAAQQPLSLKLPAAVVAMDNGSMQMNPSDKMRMQNLEIEFKGLVTEYAQKKAAGARAPELIPLFKQLAQLGMELEHLQRMEDALHGLEDSRFKIVKLNRGASANQSSAEVLPQSIVQFSVLVPLSKLFSYEIGLDVNGKRAELVGPLQVREIDRGMALVFLTAKLSTAEDLNAPFQYQFHFSNHSDEGSLANGEPVHLSATPEMSLGVATAQREILPIKMPGFGAIDLSVNAGASVQAREMMGKTKFHQPALGQFLRGEAEKLSEAMRTASEQLGQVQGLSRVESDQLQIVGRTSEQLSADLDNQSGLLAPNEGVFYPAAAVAAGFPLAQGEEAGAVWTPNVFFEVIVSGEAALLPPNSEVQIRRMNGSILKGKILSIENAALVQTSGTVRVKMRVAASVPVAAVDWTSAYGTENEAGHFSPERLFAELSSRRTDSGSAVPALSLANSETGLSQEVSSAVSPMAQIVIQTSDPQRALKIFKDQRSDYSSADLIAIVTHTGADVAYEAARALILEKQDWAALLDGMKVLLKNPSPENLSRAHAVEMAASLILEGSGTAENGQRAAILSSLQNLANYHDRHFAESFLIHLMLNGGIHSFQAQSILSADFFSYDDLGRISQSLSNSTDSAYQKLGRELKSYRFSRLGADQIVGLNPGNQLKSAAQNRNPLEPFKNLSPRNRANFAQEELAREGDLKLLESGQLSSSDPAMGFGLIDPETAQTVRRSAEETQQASESFKPLALSVSDHANLLGEWNLATFSERKQMIESWRKQGRFAELAAALSQGSSSGATDMLRRELTQALAASVEGRLYLDQLVAQKHLEMQRGVDSVYFVNLIRDAESFADQDQPGFLEKKEGRRSSRSARFIYESAIIRALQDAVSQSESDALLRALVALVPHDYAVVALIEDKKGVSADTDFILENTPAFLKNRLKQIAQFERERDAMIAGTFVVWGGMRFQAVGEFRPGSDGNRIIVFQRDLHLSHFPVSEMTLSGSPEKMGDAMLARGNLPAPLKVEVKSASERASDLMDGEERPHFSPGKDYYGFANAPTWLSLALGVLGAGVMGWLLYIFYLKFREEKEIRSMIDRGDRVFSIETMEEWRQNFAESIGHDDYGAQSTLRRNLEEWADLLDKRGLNQGDLARMAELAQSVATHPQMSLTRREITRLSDNQPDRMRRRFFAAVDLAMLTLKKMSEHPDVTNEAEFNVFKGIALKILFIKNILFTLKNLRDNTAYDARMPEIISDSAYMELNRIRIKRYRQERWGWIVIRFAYFLNKAADWMISHLKTQFQSYGRISEQLGHAVDDNAARYIQNLSRDGFKKEDNRMTADDNGAAQLSRKLKSRATNFLGALANLVLLPSLVASIYYLGFSSWILWVHIATNIAALFALTNYLAHVASNMSGRHEKHFEEALRQLEAYERKFKAAGNPSADDEVPETSALPVPSFVPSQAVSSAAVKPERRVQHMVANLQPIVDELNRSAIHGFKGSLDRALIAINEEDDFHEAEKAFRGMLDRYGYQSLDLEIVRVPGSSSGNGLPTVAFMNAILRASQEIQEAGVQNPRIVALKAFGPDTDFMKIATGSVAFTPSVLSDKQGVPIPVGALKIAQAALASEKLRGVRIPFVMMAETDTLHDHPLGVQALSVASPQEDITFFTVAQPIREAFRFGVPVLKSDEDGPQSIVGFFEKASDPERLARLINNFMPSKRLTVESEVPVFTGEVSVHILSREKQEEFRSFLGKAEAAFQEALRQSSEIDLDAVLDIWSMVIRASNDRRGTKSALERLSSLATYSNYRATVNSQKTPVDENDYAMRQKVFSDLHRKIYSLAYELNLRIGAEHSSQTQFHDVRAIPDFTQVALKRGDAGAARFRNLLDRNAVIAGLNGSFPNVKSARDFFAGVAFSGTGQPIVVHGPLEGNTAIGRRNLGVPVLPESALRNVVDGRNYPFLLDLLPDERPVFMPDTEDTAARELNAAFLDALYGNGGKPLTIMGGANALRRRGYISANEVSVTPPSHARGTNYPAYASPSRSELRSIVRLIRQGAGIAALIIFQGILPISEKSYAAVLFSQQPVIEKAAFQTDLMLSETMAVRFNSVLFGPEAQSTQTLFIEARSWIAGGALDELKNLEGTSFKITVLFTAREKEEFNRAKAILGSEKVGRLEIRLISKTVEETVRNEVAREVRANSDMKNHYAFAGTKRAAAHVRPFISNLLELNETAWPDSFILRALQSPGIFNLHWMEKNKIWSLQSLIPVLLSVERVARSA